MAKQKRGKVRDANRRMVSLPAELNRRMAETDGVNWSAVAVRAWEEEFGQLAEQKKEKVMTDVVDRLRASKIQAASEDYKEGLEFGKEWAKNYAEVRELERLERCRESSTREWDYMWDSGERDAFDGGERLAAVMLGGFDNVDRSAMDGQWEQMVGDENADRGSSGEFVRGFAEGALKVWNEVKDQI